MERDAHYAAVGIATIALLAAMAVFVVWLARLSFDSEYDVYDIVFFGPVSGLSEGSEVHFNGIRFGEVTDLNLDAQKGNQVVARVRLEADLPIRVTSRAQLQPQGITGLNIIQITAGNPESALLKSQYADNVVPVIQSQPSPIAELLQGSGAVLAQTVDALNRINRVLSDDNIRSFSSSLNSVEAVTAEFEARKTMLADLERTLASAARAVEEYEKLGASARQLVDGDGRRAVANIEQAAEEARVAMRSLSETTNSLKAPLGDFANEGLPQFTSAVQGLERATEELEGLIDEVRTSPREFIQRPSSNEIEVQP